MPAGLPLPICYGVFREEQAPVTCILLEDLGHTHSQPPWPMPATVPGCEAAVTALARLHAHWWTTELSGPHLAGVDLRKRADDLGTYLNKLMPEFLAFVGDRLTPERQDIMRAVCDKLPKLLWDRVSGGRPITRVHGDLHNWNILYPNDPSLHDCVFIDWEDWQYYPGPFDLAYMMAYFWFPDRRAQHEENLLRLYHDALLGELPAPYSWQHLKADYRLGHLYSFVIPWFQLELEMGPDALVGKPGTTVPVVRGFGLR